MKLALDPLREKPHGTREGRCNRPMAGAGGTRLLASSVNASPCFARARKRSRRACLFSNLGRYFASRQWVLYRLELSILDNSPGVTIRNHGLDHSCQMTTG